MGFEPTTSSLGSWMPPDSKSVSASTSGEHPLPLHHSYTDLAADSALTEVLEAWGRLPEAIKAGVLALVRAVR
jgi:hypothetical protein